MARGRAGPVARDPYRDGRRRRRRDRRLPPAAGTDDVQVLAGPGRRGEDPQERPVSFAAAGDGDQDRGGDALGEHDRRAGLRRAGRIEDARLAAGRGKGGSHNGGSCRSSCPGHVGHV